MPKFCLKKPVLGEKPLFESKMYAVGGSPIQDFALFWAFPYDDGDEDDCLEVCKMLLIPTFTARAQPFLIFPGPLHFFAKGISFQILNLREQRQDKHFIHRDVNVRFLMLIMKIMKVMVGVIMTLTCYCCSSEVFQKTPANRFP